ncbi:Putative K(+)-stimulated pyrophosphate-energized sodium pump [Streptomyces badius]
MLALFAVALAGTGLLTTVGVIVAMDTFGPVSDNAQGIAEMSGDVTGAGAQVLTDLDAVGNTTKAITKGIAIATAVLAAAALFGSYRDAIATAVDDVGAGAGELGLSLDISQPNNLVGLILGATVVFRSRSPGSPSTPCPGPPIPWSTRSGGSSVSAPGSWTTGEARSTGVVDICTRYALRELATPGLLAVLAPIAVGFTLGVGALGSYLAGAIGAGTLMAVFLANSGGAWDNAKKLVEDGLHGGKGSEAHAATVIGDTVGDPFKDTAGSGDQPAPQGDEPDRLAHRPGDRAVQLRRGREPLGAGAGGRRRQRDHRRGGVRLQAAGHRRGRRRRPGGRRPLGPGAGSGGGSVTRRQGTGRPWMSVVASS